MSDLITQVLNGDIRIGDDVIAIENNDYAHLIGKVISIDKKGTPEHSTDNESDDINVDFKAYNYPPWMLNDIVSHFDALFDIDVGTYEDLPIDDVIMAPDMLIRITELGEGKIHDLICDYDEAVEFCKKALDEIGVPNGEPASTTDLLKEIRTIEGKYGLMLFRMGLTHLVHTGHDLMSEYAVIEDSINAIMAQGEVDKANGVTPIMTPEFQCNIVRCAYELTRFSIWTLFAYIKKHVVVDNDKQYVLIYCCERDIQIYGPYDSLQEARDIMKADLIEAMDGVDDSVMDDYEKGEDYEWEPEDDDTWYTHRRGNHDWKIIAI